MSNLNLKIRYDLRLLLMIFFFLENKAFCPTVGANTPMAVSFSDELDIF